MKKIFFLLLWIFMPVNKDQAQNIELDTRTPREQAEAQELSRIIYDLNHQEKSFFPVALQRMLAEANYLSDELKLPPPNPITRLDLVDYHVSQPWFGVIHDQSPGLSMVDQALRSQVTAKGFIATTNYSFSFADGRFSVVSRLEPDEVNHYDQWRKIPSLIDTNEAYQLATQWLAAVGVKMGTLEIKHGKRKIEQAFVRDPIGTTNKTMLPIFNVTWGDDSANYIAEVRMLGTTKELLALRVNEASISRRPPLIVSSVAAFEKYVKAQTNLPAMYLQSPPTNSANSNTTN